MKLRRALDRLFEGLNPVQPLYETIDLWDRFERRRIAMRILDDEQPGRRHTDAEWDALADDALSRLERSRKRGDPR